MQTGANPLPGFWCLLLAIAIMPGLIAWAMRRVRLTPSP
jgi:hypothetical protein